MTLTWGAEETLLLVQCKSLFFPKNCASLVIPVPMGNKVRANDWTCLLSSGWKRAI